MKLHYRKRLEVAYLSVCMDWRELELPPIQKLIFYVVLYSYFQPGSYTVLVCFILMGVFELDGTVSLNTFGFVLNR